MNKSNSNSLFKINQIKNAFIKPFEKKIKIKKQGSDFEIKPRINLKSEKEKKEKKEKKDKNEKKEIKK